MLRELSIRNFAIIDDLKIEFSDGFTVLTGETGAGKSIIINAVNLLLGSRATSQLIRSGADAAELEAFFAISAGSRVAETIQSLGYASEDGLLARRIISQTDKSRIYINGRLATIAVLNQITENLASISGQHAHQGLLKEDNHLIIIDRFGGLLDLRRTVHRQYHEMLPLIRRLDELKQSQERRQEQQELYRFQKNEIHAAAIAPGEDAALEEERVRLKHSAALYQAVYEGIETLYSADGAVIETLSAVAKTIEKASRMDGSLQPVVQQVQTAGVQLEDAAETLRSYLGSLQMDDARLEAVEARIDLLNRLKRKYGGSLEAIFRHLEQISESLSGIETLPEKIAETEKKLLELHNRLSKVANDLSVKRRRAAQELIRRVEAELSSLRMEKTRFDVSLQPLSAPPEVPAYLAIGGVLVSESGIDHAVFRIAPNIGEPLKPLADIASGGELSRVVLALKAILAETGSVETIVFDEVDAGIGGGVADVVGKKLSDLSKYHQIICITHLPQIARFGDHHYQISKHVHENRTRTTIRRIGADQRVEEIARMLGGVKITAATRAHALELLEKS